MKKLLFGFAAFSLATCAMTSCSSDDEKNDLDIPGGSGTMEEYTPEESKEFLEDVATQALNMLNPNDQKEVIDLCGYFSEEYGDLELPDNFFSQEYDSPMTKTFFSGLEKALGSNDGSALTRVAVDYAYDINFNNYRGIYEPGTYQWEKVASSDDVIFRFKNASGQNCELKATGSSNTYDTTVTWTEDYYYDQETTEINLTVPAEINIYLTSGDSQLLSAKVISDVSFENKKFNINADVNVANISVKAVTSGNDNKVNETLAMSVNGTPYITSTGYLSGNHLFDIQYWNDYYNGEDEEKIFNEMFKNGEATVTLLNQVSVDLIYTWVQGLSGLWFDYDDDYDYEKYISILNQAFKANVRYNNTTTVQATLAWEVERDEYDSYYAEIVPVIKFTSDNSTYYFWQYFDNSFNGVETLFNNVVRKYQALIDAAF